MSNTIGSLPSLFTPQPHKTQKSSEKSAGTSDAISEFLAYQKMLPQEKIRDSLLKKYGLTEESLAGQPAETRKKFEEEVRQEILKELKGKFAEKGILLDISA